MPIVISALHFPWREMDDCLRVVRAELRLDGVELSLAGSFARPHCTRADLEVLPALRGDLRLAGHIWEDLAQLGRAAGTATLLDWLEVCRAAGIGSLVLHGGSHDDRAYGLRVTREILDAVAVRYERAGVTLLLENHYAYDYRDGHELFSEPWEVAELFAALDSPAVRCCFDTGHGHLTHNWPELLDAMAPYLRHIHLADNGGLHDDHLPYRRGTVPWNAMLAHWQGMAYAHTFCVEFPVREDRAPFVQCRDELVRHFPGICHADAPYHTA